MVNTINTLLQRGRKAGNTVARVFALLVVSTLIGAYVLPVLGAFNPGDTLDPNCLPSDPSCTVTLTGVGTTTWGSIAGSVADQLDLQAVLDTKVATSALNTFIDDRLALATTVGTIASGTWQGTPIADGYFDKTGDWTGTFAGQNSSYYLDATHLANFSTPFLSQLSTITTDSIAEGSTNKYYNDGLVDAHVDTRINAITTLSGLTTAPALSLVGTIASGIWEATPIADGYFDKTGNWDGTFGGQTASYYLDANNLSNLSSAVVTALGSVTTDDIPEGSTNKYYTDGAVDARIDAATTLSNLISLPNLAAVGTIGVGTWQGTPIADSYLDKSGNWAGTFDGHAGSYYLDAQNLNNFGTVFAAQLSGISADDIPEGSTNKYYTDAKVSAVLAASSSLVKTYSTNVFTGANTFSGTLTFAQFPQKSGSLIPSHDYDFTTKSYVDSLIVGQSARGSARVVTTTALPSVTYDNGASGVGATLTADANGALPQIDNVTLIVDDRLLVKDQADPKQNGVYIVTQVGDGSNPFILTRATDYDSPSEITNGSFVPITSGLVYANTVWIMTSMGTMTVGSTDIDLTQLSISPASYTASNGIQINSNDFQLDLAENEGLALAGSSLKVDYDGTTIGIVNNKLAAMNIGAAATNTLPYYASAGSVLSGASGLFTTGTKLGIGTSTPSAYVDTYQSIAGALNALNMRNTSTSSSAYTALLFANDTANGAGLYLNSSARTNDAGTNGLSLYNDAGALRLRANGTVTIATGVAPGTDRLTVASSGNVGIGTSTPGALLTVAGTVYTTGSIGVGTSSPVAKLSIVAGGASGATQGIVMTDSNGIGKFAVLDNGRMGVGTTTGITAGLVANFTGLVGFANQSAYDIAGGRIAAGSSVYSYGTICVQNTLATCIGSNGVVIGSTTTNTAARVNIPSLGTSFFTDSVAIGTTTASAKLNVGIGAGFTSYGQPTAARPLIEATNLSGQSQASIGVAVETSTNQPRIALFADATNSVFGLAGQYASGTPAMVFRNGGTEYMRISSTGNVGIGSTNPTSKLSITQGSITEANKQPIIIAQGTYIGPYTSDITNYTYSTTLTNANITTGKAVYANQYSVTMTGTSSSDGNVYAFYTRPYMQGSGTFSNVLGFTVDPYLFGTSSTGVWNQYIGMNISGGAYGGGATSNAGTVYQLNIGNPNFGTTTKRAVNIAAISGATTNYAIYSAGGQSYHAGNFGIGSTTPGYPLSVVGLTMSTGGFLIPNNQSYRALSNTGTSSAILSVTTANNIQLSNLYNTGGIQYILNNDSGVHQWYTGSTTVERMRLTNLGYLGIGTSSPAQRLTVAGTVGFPGLSTAGSSYAALCLNSTTGEVFVNTGTQTCTVSSARFKHDIETLTATSGLEFVNKLRPVSFTLNETNETRLGFVAEEVNALDPRLVGFEADGVTPRTVRYEEMTAVLAKAVQELDLKIQTIASTSVGTLPAHLSREWFIGSLRGFGILLNETMISMKSVAIEALTAKSLTIETDTLEANGITLTDRATGNKTCMYVEGGVVKASPGPCVAPVTPVAPNHVEGGLSGTSTEPIESTGTTTASSTATTTPDTGATTTPETASSTQFVPPVTETVPTETTPETVVTEEPAVPATGSETAAPTGGQTEAPAVDSSSSETTAS